MIPFKREAQIFAGKHPSVFFKLYKLKGEERIVRPDTQLVIEGFPRSANTFSVWAFRQAQQEDVRLAHHLHYPAQVIRAAQWRIPTLVLLRLPQDAVTSWVMRDPQPVAQALRHYVSFYESIAEYRHAFVLALFREVTSDFGLVTERLNDRFGTDFAVFCHNEENVNKVFARIEERHRTRNRGEVLETRVARPSTKKQGAREAIRSELDSLEQRRLVADAEAVYDYLVERRNS